MAAVLLKETGHEVVGLTAELSAGLIARYYGPSRASTNAESARAVAESYGFPLHTVNLENDFYSIIVQPFCSEYLSGKTPNPCIHCDSLIKFDRLLRHARSLGCEKIASGHYARIMKAANGRYYVARGRETVKDQSYFLFMLSQESMKDIIFPLGDYTKSKVRKMAEERRLSAAERPESQEICFIPDNRYAEFIERATGKAPGPGDIVNTVGKVIGQHRGIHTYTIGQRRGLGIASLGPLYVVSIDARNNRIVAGHREELETAGLFADTIHYMRETDLNDRRVLVKTRSTQTPVAAYLKKEDNGILVVFREPQVGISPGQAAVFYGDEMDILGGGIIVRSIKNMTGSEP